MHISILHLVFFLKSAELLGIGHRPDTFSYAELRAATGDFNSSNKLGEGGFGNVYKVHHCFMVQNLHFTS